MKSKIIVKQKSKVKQRPAVAFPGLAQHLFIISQKVSELQELTKPEAIAQTLGVTRQAVQYHVGKQKGSK